MYNACDTYHPYYVVECTYLLSVQPFSCPLRVVSHKEEIMEHFFLVLQESWVSIVGLQQNTYLFLWDYLCGEVSFLETIG